MLFRSMESLVTMALTSILTAANVSALLADVSQTSPGTIIIALVNAMPLASCAIQTSTGTKNDVRASVMRVCQQLVLAIIILILILAIANVTKPTFQLL